MHKNFKLVSLSHIDTPVAYREKMYLPENECKIVLNQIREVLGLSEVMVLSTCNRTEVYYAHPKDHNTEIIKLLCLQKGISDSKAIAAFFSSVTDHYESCDHLFEVSLGLKSGVIGDLQVSNQSKHAYSWANEQKLAGPFLHRIMHTVFHANKRVQQETEYRDGAASVSYASAQLAKDLVLYHKNPSALIIGAGEMGADVARNLQGGPFERIAITNRTTEKAQLLADETGIECLPFTKLNTFLGDFDIIVCTAELETPLITEDSFDKNVEFHNKFLIDLGVPRSIDENVEKIPGLILYNIDEIIKKTQETVSKRKKAIPSVKAIIKEELSSFHEWLEELSISPTINRFKEAIESIRKDEIKRVLKGLSKKEEALINQVTRGMVNKIIKLPVLQLKEACKRGDQENLIGVLNDLFNLEAIPEKEKRN